MKLICDGLDFPTSICFDDQSRLYVGESGIGFGGARRGGRLSRVEADGSLTPLLDGLKWPLNGITYRNGGLFLSEGGYPGRISRYDIGSGQVTTLLDNLPGMGNYHTCMSAFGPDGKLYFSQGALTNNGIIGLDAYELGWLRKLPHNVDIPGYTIELVGGSVESENPFHGEEGELGGAGPTVRTGAFAPFGREHPAGTRIPGTTPCTASMMRCNEDGSGLELVAWGLRNSYGLGFLPDGRLLVSDQSGDDRGSRPTDNAPDLLYEVKEGAWYGWPDFLGAVPLTDPRFRSSRGPRVERLLANHHELPPPERPLLEFPVNSAPTKFCVAPAGTPWAGDLLICLFGDEKPMTGPAGPRVGRSLARIDTRQWTLHPLHQGPFQRPMDVRFHPETRAVYLMDFGHFEMVSQRDLEATPGSGKIWRLEF